MYDAVVGIQDIRYLVAIMFGTTDQAFIEKVLEAAKYPIGTPESFAQRLRTVFSQWDESRVKFNENGIPVLNIK